MRTANRTLVVLLALLSPSAALAQAQVASGATFFGSSDFWQKFAIAAIGALAGFIGNYVLARRKERREPSKQLAYDQSIIQALGSKDAKLPDKLKILYDNKEAHGLFMVAVNVENSGNTVIKNQFLRFAFDSDAEVLDAYFDPQSEREVGAAPDASFAPSSTEHRFAIAHLERGQRIAFRFIVSAKSTPSLSLHPFNDTGDVQFVTRDIKAASDSRAHVVEFVRLFVLFTIVPPVLYLIPISEISNSAAGIVRLMFVALMLPHVKSFSRAVGQVILILESRRTVESSVRVVSAERIDVLDIRTQSQG